MTLLLAVIVYTTAAEYISHARKSTTCSGDVLSWDGRGLKARPVCVYMHVSGDDFVSCEVAQIHLAAPVRTSSRRSPSAFHSVFVFTSCTRPLCVQSGRGGRARFSLLPFLSLLLLHISSCCDTMFAGLQEANFFVAAAYRRRDRRSLFRIVLFSWSFAFAFVRVDVVV